MSLTPIFMRKSEKEEEKTFLRYRNILSKKERFFGINDGTNIDPEKDIV